MTLTRRGGGVESSPGAMGAAVTLSALSLYLAGPLNHSLFTARTAE